MLLVADPDERVPLTVIYDFVRTILNANQKDVVSFAF